MVSKIELYEELQIFLGREGAKDLLEFVNIAIEEGLASRFAEVAAKADVIAA